MLIVQSCPILCNPRDCSSGSSVHGILQPKILKWVAMPSSRGSSDPGIKPRVSYIASRFFTIWATRKAKPHLSLILCPNVSGLRLKGTGKVSGGQAQLRVDEVLMWRLFGLLWLLSWPQNSREG